jgi:hypothetical protein
MTLKKQARPTLTAVEMDIDDTLAFTLVSGETRRIRVCEAHANVWESNLAQAGEGCHAKVVLRMFCRLEVDGVTVSINRWVGSQDSFYEPVEYGGLRIWFDAAAALFDHLKETHGPCKPRKAVRLAIQDGALGIAPVLLHPWCPLPAGRLRIEDCYQGSDCWMGPYYGVDAHGGLDINHPAGTPLWAPICFDTQGYFNSLANGDNNNRWRGIKRWPDGATWVLQAHHIMRLRVPENTPLDAGTLYADTAGVYIGSHEHTHFVFGIVEPGASMEDMILIDPWILFRQMYRDHALTRV